MGYGKQISTPGDDLRQCWQTLPKVFEPLNELFHFSVDACATAENALLPRYWTKEDDCRKQSWEGEIVYCNPPFSFVKDIVPKALEAITTVFLLPITCLATNYMALTPAPLVAVPNHRMRFIPPPGLEVKTISPSLATLILVYGEATQDQQDGLQKLGYLIYENRTPLVNGKD